MVVTVALAWLGCAWWVERVGRRPLPSGESFDAIVVPGCRVLSDGRPSSTFERRIRTAVGLFVSGRAPALICTGGVGDAPYAESEVARDLAIELGVPADSIWTETASTTTETNASNAAAAFPAATDARVLVVTDAFHVWRACRVFGRHFGSATGYGVIHPSVGLRARFALREVWVIAGYAVLGRL
jgi:uncharacterized SAM-binding protein YcdF (DUF218 family)